MVTRMLDLPGDGEAGDAADALAVALCHACLAPAPRARPPRDRPPPRPHPPQGHPGSRDRRLGRRLPGRHSPLHLLPARRRSAPRRRSSSTPTCARTPSPSSASSPTRSRPSSSASSPSPGVGPKVALGILSGIEAPDLVEALRGGDVARLTRIPGVGKKTAERLVLELKDKMPPPGAAAARSRGPGQRLARRPRLRPRPPRLLAARGRARRRPGAPGGQGGPVRGPPAAQPSGTLRTVTARDRSPPRLRPAPRRRRRLRHLAAAPPPRRVRGPAPGRRQPPRGHRGGAEPRRGPRPRPLLRAPRGGQDQPRPRHRRRARGAPQGHRRPHHRARGRPRRPPHRPRAREVLFVDEIHRLDARVEEILYPALEDYTLDLMIGTGPGARSMKIPLKPFTLVGATTRAGLLTGPLRSRFGIVHRLDFYSEDDLAFIVNRSARILDVPIEEAGAREIARRSRGTPRIANRLLRRVRDFAQVRAQGVITEAVAKDALALLEVDAHGFDEVDRKLLLTIIDKFGGRAGGRGRPRRRHQRRAGRHRGHLRALPPAARVPRPHPAGPHRDPARLRALRPRPARRPRRRRSCSERPRDSPTATTRSPPTRHRPGAPRRARRLAPARPRPRERAPCGTTSSATCPTSWPRAISW